MASASFPASLVKSSVTVPEAVKTPMRVPGRGASPRIFGRGLSSPQIARRGIVLGVHIVDE